MTTRVERFLEHLIMFLFTAPILLAFLVLVFSWVP